MSEWKVSEPLWIHNLGFHEDSLRRMAQHHVTPRPWLTGLIPNETKNNRQLRRRLALAFTEDIGEGKKYKYKQSIAISELLFDDASLFPTPHEGPRYNEAAGVVYPAMRMRGAADNVFIFPKFVDSSLVIRSARYVLVEAADEKAASYTFLTLASADTFSNGKIIWRDSQLAPEHRRSHIALENNRWVLRDGFNRVYDSH